MITPLIVRRGHAPAAIALLAIAALFCFEHDLFARAGGAGGFDSGGSGDGEGLGALIYLLIQVIFRLPFPLNLIVAGVIVGGFIVFSRISQKKLRQQTILNRLPTGQPVKTARGYDAFKAANPDFNEAEFMHKVKVAFIDIQKAWESQDVSTVRRFISDGVYQRFNTQFRMMQLLKQKNTVSDINIINTYIDRVESDGLFDIVHVAIHASMKDRFISELDPSLNSDGSGEFVEYWSFMKKRGAVRKDMYLTESCPNCGSPLPGDMGEKSACPSCGTLTNSGEYDWVLSEITQADDYISTHRKLEKTSALNAKIRELVEENEDFSVQLVEDKASNGYLQIVTALAMKDPAIMRRFVSDSVYEKVSSMMEGERIVYNRIFLNDVTLLGVTESGSEYNLAISVRSSFQRVRLEDGRAFRIDPVVISKTEVVIMSRDRKAGENRGSVYAHSCPSCGAPVENSLDVHCAYCGNAMNSTRNEWIITAIMSLGEYADYLESGETKATYSVSANLIDKLYDVRDFAFNNVLVVMAADGTLSDRESEFVRELAGKWGYDTERIEPLFQMALNSQLVIKMPEDAKKRRKIYKMMEKAARADEIVTDEERRVLESVRSEYGIGSEAA